MSSAAGAADAVDAHAVKTSASARTAVKNEEYMVREWGGSGGGVGGGVVRRVPLPLTVRFMYTTGEDVPIELSSLMPPAQCLPVVDPSGGARGT